MTDDLGRDRDRDEYDEAFPEGDYVPLPRRGDGPRRFLSVLFVIGILLAAVVGIGVIWAARQMTPSGPQGEVIERVTIPRGASTPSIAGILEDEGIISSGRVFTAYVALKKEGGWKAGDYVNFRRNSSFGQAIAVLDDGPILPTSKVVRVLEGTRLVDALEEIATQMGTVTVEDLQSALDSGQVHSDYKPDNVASWEGLLFPDTYQFADDATAVTILQTMVDKMDAVLDDLSFQRADALTGKSAYELIVIASLIERESGQPEEERGKISRVIFNRLEANERLDLDAPVLYGLGRARGSLTKSDLERDTPYNTRRNRGLPPTPIALSGKASLRAAIEPAVGDWRYYVLVSNDPPSHFFTASYDEFLDQKADAQRRGVF